MTLRNTWRTVLSLAILGGCFALSGAGACPFCSAEKGPTLVGEFNLADMALFGHMENTRTDSNGDFVTDFVIENVIKPHDIIKDKKTITIMKKIPPVKSKFVVFCDIYKGKIDPYKACEVAADSDMVKYITGAVQLKDKAMGERLRYCFDYLNNPEFEIALDAYKEFAKADYKDYSPIAKKLPADTIAGWLKDPKTPPFRYGLYASLLGHCGTAEHAKLLRTMIDDSLRRKVSDIDGILAGYLMLEPKEGWSLLLNILGDERQEFGLRYTCLRIVSFLWAERSDLVDHKELTKGFASVLPQAEMADFGVEYLRKHKCWETTNQVLDLWGKKSHDILIIKRAIMRFALQSPEPRAVAFVQQQRQRDARWVADVEDLLKSER